MKMKNQNVLKAIKIIEVIALALALSSFASVKGQAPQNKNEAVAGYYTLSVYDGRVAVFENGSDKPETVFDTYISSLPYPEQNELQNGITVYDRQELQKLIEDYTS